MNYKNMEENIKQLNNYIQTLRGWIQTNANNTGEVFERVERMEEDITKIKGWEILINNISSGSVSGDVVSSLNNITGDVDIIAGSGITVTNNGQEITIAATGGGGNIDSINGDTTPAQLIVGAGGITVGTVGGTTTITAPTATSPGGVDTNVQFNDGGVFGGVSDFIFDKVDKAFSVGDVTGTTNNTLFELNDSASSIQFASDIQAGYFDVFGMSPTQIFGFAPGTSIFRLTPTGDNAFLFMGDATALGATDATIGIGAANAADTDYARTIISQDNIALEVGTSTGGSGTDEQISYLSMDEGSWGAGYFSITDNVNHQFRVGGSGLTMTYDNGGLGERLLRLNNIGLTLSDGSGNRVIDAKVGDKDISIGDTSSSANGTRIDLSDVNENINHYLDNNFQIWNAAGTGAWFGLNPTNQLVNIGDIDGIGNGTLLTIDDVDQAVKILNANVGIGIGTDTPLGKLESRSTSGAQIVASYDALNDASLTVDSSGNLNVDLTGERTIFSSDIYVENNTPIISVVDTDGNQASGRLGADNGGIFFASDTDGLDFRIFTTTSLGVLTERMRIKDTGLVGIGTNSPDASAKLDVSSTTSGFLPPRMTTTQKNAISSPATGLVVYDTTLDKLCVYTGASWETITSV